MNKKVLAFVVVLVVALAIVFAMQSNNETTEDLPGVNVAVEEIADTSESQELSNEIDSLIESEVNIDIDIAELESLEF